MVRFDGATSIPQRNCDTLSYELKSGACERAGALRRDTDYIRNHYNRARDLNRSAARLAMSVFQRRLASSTFALLRSFERRKEKLAALIDDIRNGRLTEEQLARQQRHLDDLDDLFETHTADEDATPEGDGEEHEGFENKALAGDHCGQSRGARSRATQGRRSACKGAHAVRERSRVQILEASRGSAESKIRRSEVHHLHGAS